MEGVGGAAGWRACAADAWVEQRYDSGGGGIVRTSGFPESGEVYFGIGRKKKWSQTVALGSGSRAGAPPRRRRRRPRATIGCSVVGRRAGRVLSRHSVIMSRDFTNPTRITPAASDVDTQLQASAAAAKVHAPVCAPRAFCSTAGARYRGGWSGFAFPPGVRYLRNQSCKAAPRELGTGRRLVACHQLLHTAPAHRARGSITCAAAVTGHGTWVARCSSTTGAMLHSRCSSGWPTMLPRTLDEKRLRSASLST